MSLKPDCAITRLCVSRVGGTNLLRGQYLRRELFIRHCFSRDELLERVSKEKRVVSVVVAEFEFIEVAVEMLAGNLMERTDKATLEQAECAFDRVGVNI